MKYKNVLKAAAIVSAGLIAMTGCTAAGGGNGDSGGGSANQIRIGVLADAAPFSSENMGSREYEGFEIDLARALVADALGDDVEIVFEPVTKATRIPMIQGNEVDLLLATLSITPEREEAVSFSVPYYSSPNGIMVKEDSSIKTVEDTKGARLCVPQGSAVWDSYRGSLEKMPEYEGIADSYTLVELPSPADCLLALRQERDVDVVVNDFSTLSGQIAEVSGVRMLDELVGANDNVFGIAFNKGNDELLGKINKSLCGMFEDGRWAQIYTDALGEAPSSDWAPDCSNQ